MFSRLKYIFITIKNIFQSGEHLSILINMPGLQIFKHIYIIIYMTNVEQTIGAFCEMPP